MSPLPGAAAQCQLAEHPAQRCYRRLSASRDLPGSEDLLGPGAPPPPRGITSPPGHHPQRVHRPPRRCTVSRSITPHPRRHHTQPSSAHPCTAGAPLPQPVPGHPAPPVRRPSRGGGRGLLGAGHPPPLHKGLRQGARPRSYPTAAAAAAPPPRPFTRRRATPGPEPPPPLPR